MKSYYFEESRIGYFLNIHKNLLKMYRYIDDYFNLILKKIIYSFVIYSVKFSDEQRKKRTNK